MANTLVTSTSAAISLIISSSLKITFNQLPNVFHLSPTPAFPQPDNKWRADNQKHIQFLINFLGMLHQWVIIENGAIWNVSCNGQPIKNFAQRCSRVLNKFVQNFIAIDSPSRNWVESEPFQTDDSQTNLVLENWTGAAFLYLYFKQPFKI